MERFFVAASLHDVPAAVLDHARAAFDQFERSVATHAGSRDAFETMMTEQAAGEGAEAEWPGAASDFKHKRAAFRANSIMWGRQARVFCATKIIHPSSEPGMVDGAFIKGIVGLHRTRRSVPLQTTAHHWRTPNAGEPTNPNPPEPLDPRESGADAIGLLRDFCSQPIPQFRLRVSRQGYRSHEMIGDTLGPAGEVTYFTGEIRRAESAVPGAGAEGSAPGAQVLLFKAVDMPLEVFNGDILVHRSLWDTRPPEVSVFAWPLDNSTEFRESDLLPLTERAEYLGEGIDAARTPLIPRYSDILSYTMSRMNWSPGEFRVFRCRVDFPVLYTRIRLTLG